MSRKLEDFIREHRDEFNSYEPHPEAWQQIAGRSFGKRPPLLTRSGWIRWIAAAVLVISLSVFYFVNRPATSPAGTQAREADPEIPSAYAGKLLLFSKQVQSKEQELRKYSRAYPDLYKGFTEDINRMDSSYEEMKSMLSESPDKEVLLESMIENLQLQLDLLNQQMQVIKQIKNAKKDNHEKKNVTI